MNSWQCKSKIKSQYIPLIIRSIVFSFFSYHNYSTSKITKLFPRFTKNSFQERLLQDTEFFQLKGLPKYFIVGLPYEPRHEKSCFSHMRTTKAQISLHIRPVWSAPLLLTAWIISISEISRLASCCGCAGQFESHLVGNPEDRFSHDEAH